MGVRSITALMAMSVLAKEAGAIEFFTKPFRDHDLLDETQVVVDGDRGRQANPQQHKDAAESPRVWTEANGKDRAHGMLAPTR
jgi:FixJ family two-component response regulator